MPDALSGCLSENCWKPKDKRVSLTLLKHANTSQWGCKGLPGAARWLGCAASLCTAGPPGWELAVGDLDSGPEDWTTFSCTGQPEAKKTTRCQQWNVPSQTRPASSGTWLVYMARRALLNSIAWSCFFTSLYSTPSAFVSLTFFFESNTFWSCENKCFTMTFYIS